MSIYLVDGKETDWKELIKLARWHGYEDNDGIYSTSRAAIVLRECGIEVKEKEGRDERKANTVDVYQAGTQFYLR